MHNSHICQECGYTGTNSNMQFQATSRFFNVYVRRIRYNLNNRAKKLKTKVSFTDNLEIRVPNLDEERLEHRFHYELISFVKHIGANVTSGHYVTIIKSGEDWELHDDNYISTLGREAVFSGHSFENVYLLTYRRLDFQYDQV